MKKNKKRLNKKIQKKRIKRTNRLSNSSSSQSIIGKSELHSSGVTVYPINVDTLDVTKFSNSKFRNKLHKKPFTCTQDNEEFFLRYNKNLRGFEMGIPFPYLPNRDGETGEFSPTLTNVNHKIPLMYGMSENDIPLSWKGFMEHLKDHDNQHCLQLGQNMSTYSQCYFVTVGVIFGLIKMGIKKEFKFTQGLIDNHNEITGMREGCPNTWVEDSDGLVYDMSMSSDVYGDEKLSSPEEYNDKYWGCPNHVYYEKRHIIPETVNYYSLEDVLKRRKEEGVLYMDTELIKSGGLNDIVFLDHKGEKFYYPTLEEVETQILKHNGWVSLPPDVHWTHQHVLGVF